MKPFNKYEGTIVPIMYDNIDTDQLIPKQFLKSIKRTGFGDFVFDEWRYNEDRSNNVEFNLNKPEYKAGTILITGENFGCGSSREHAPWALADYGFKVIIAPSYADIFFNNCFNNAILPIKLDNSLMDVLFDNTEKILGYSLSIDLENQLISDNQGFRVTFDISEFNKHKLLNGLDDIGVTLLKAEKIDDYERKMGN